MSVLKSKRTESKAEFVNTANKIYIQTLRFLSRLSARYSRLLSGSVMQLASDVLDNCEKANSIFPSDNIRKDIRERYLLEARAALMALDVHLAHCYELMLCNPQGCFEKEITSEKAKGRLNKMSQSLGELIDNENRLLTAILKSDKMR